LNISLPNSLNHIPFGAFFECSSLKDVEVPQSVKSIADGAFYKCTSLTNAVLVEGLEVLGVNEEHEQLFEDGVYGVFEGCSALKNILIPHSVTNISAQAFRYCSYLSEVILSNALEGMGSGAFADCVSLKNIEVPGSLSDIPDSTFYNCSSLTNVVILEGVKNIGGETPGSIIVLYGGTFENCIALERVVIPSTVASIASNAFSGCNAIKDLTLSNYLLQRYGIMFFPSYRDIEKLTITGQSKDLENAESKIVWNYGFHECISLKDVEIGEGVVGLDCAFER
jgi:hypothetical protein